MPVSSSLATAPVAPSGNANTRKGTKASKQSKVVVLNLPPDKLAQFSSSKPPSRKGTSKSKSTASSASTPKPTVASASPVDNISDSNSTPAPSGTPGPSNLLTPAEASKRKGVPGPKPGTKRTAPLGPDGLPKPRGKPGPKKKPRLEDGTADGTDNGFTNKAGPSAIPPLVAHKLGPKANQGAINAGLRALDRTGKPCRKWIKKGLQIKSFTGVAWQLPTWRAPKSTKINANGETDRDTRLNVDSDGKENKCSSGLNSEGKSSSTGDVEMGGMGSVQGSSPAAVVTTEA
ncbi:hypothetical protein FGG08_002608 [Glutinoglossum americanum]|uniref:INO80 complex, subunit Ies4 n=1 Tax=Glutinoglossum americanum TaxID=1670608 RepID=A0A9P8HZT4_9PEZI|nr:hypothetical protein FGG08_002608 [Glutinoglossum americanum]